MKPLQYKTYTSHKVLFCLYFLNKQVILMSFFFIFLFPSLLTFLLRTQFMYFCSDTFLPSSLIILPCFLELSLLIFCGNLYWQLIFIIPYDYRVYRHLLLTRCFIFSLLNTHPTLQKLCMHNDKHKLYFFIFHFRKNY